MSPPRGGPKQQRLLLPPPSFRFSPRRSWRLLSWPEWSFGAISPIHARPGSRRGAWATGRRNQPRAHRSPLKSPSRSPGARKPPKEMPARKSRWLLQPPPASLPPFHRLRRIAPRCRHSPIPHCDPGRIRDGRIRLRQLILPSARRIPPKGSRMTLRGRARSMTERWRPLPRISPVIRSRRSSLTPLRMRTGLPAQRLRKRRMAGNGRRRHRVVRTIQGGRTCERDEMKR